MKMVMAIVHRDETPRVLEALIAAGHTATFNDSRGGVLRQARQTLFIGVEDGRMEEVLSIIKDHCRSSVSLDSIGPEGSAQPGSRRSEDRNPGGPAQPGSPDPGRVAPTRTWVEVGAAAVFVWTIERFEIY